MLNFRTRANPIPTGYMEDEQGRKWRTYDPPKRRWYFYGWVPIPQRVYQQLLNRLKEEMDV